MAAVYLAAGLDPKRSTIFLQSDVKEHTELAWLLNTITPLGNLQRMTQYKEKGEKYRKNLNAGLLNYPVLMAADILLYDTEVVPVGEDQTQHVELTRNIARRFNQRFGDTFHVPQARTPRKGARVMSLSEPEKKMSKSGSEESYISLFDPPEEIKKKIGSAVTDTGKEIRYDPQNKPGISNLLSIHALFSGKETEQLEKEYAGKGYKEFKEDTSLVLINALEPFRTKKEELMRDKGGIEKILQEGSKEATERAQEKMKMVRERMGIT